MGTISSTVGAGTPGLAFLRAVCALDFVHYLGNRASRLYYMAERTPLVASSSLAPAATNAPETGPSTDPKRDMEVLSDAIKTQESGLRRSRARNLGRILFTATVLLTLIALPICIWQVRARVRHPRACCGFMPRGCISVLAVSRFGLPSEGRAAHCTGDGCAQYVHCKAAILRGASVRTSGHLNPKGGPLEPPSAKKGAYLLPSVDVAHRSRDCGPTHRSAAQRPQCLTRMFTRLCLAAEGARCRKPHHCVVCWICVCGSRRAVVGLG